MSQVSLITTPMLARNYFNALHIEGDDAKTFLQGQLTNDLNALSLGDSQWTAHCNIKGRVIALFELWQLDTHHFVARIPTDLVDTVVKTLQRYVFRSKVTFEVQAAETLPDVPNGELNTFLAEQFKQGFADINNSNTAHFLTHELNLIPLNATSLTKGCFIGQEIVARMHYLGKQKKQCVMLETTEAWQSLQKLDNGEVICATEGLSPNVALVLQQGLSSPQGAKQRGDLLPHAVD